jgi:FMN phosphatase YigB (HAD superfamily)
MRDITLPAGIRGVVFDVGETLVDETRAWTSHARSAGVTPFALMGVLGALIERGVDHRGVWDVLDVSSPPGFAQIEEIDLYADALPCLQAAKAAGLVVGIAGNQPDGAEAQLRAAGFEADFIASSANWGVSKPSAEFFSRVTRASRLDAEAILYVGDRLDNDVLPAREAGMRTAFIRRGPWGYIHAQRPEAELADVCLSSLAELTRAWNQATPRAR